MMRKYAHGKDKCTFIARQGLSVFNETSIKHHSVGCMTYKCSVCEALMFKEEQERDHCEKTTTLPNFLFAVHVVISNFPQLKNLQKN